MTVIALFVALACQNPASSAPTPAIPELIGEPRYYSVKRGDSLYRIARAHGVGALELARANDLGTQSVKAGTKLAIPTVHVPPLPISHGIVLNIPEKALYVFRDGRFVRRFAGAIGKPSSQTALGSYVLRNKVVNPTWRPPRSMVLNEGVKDEPVPPGPSNPLGDRWMGWSKPGFGFHSTLSPRSIGRAASHGCVRLYPEGARDMFKIVAVGMPIHSVYRPALLGKRDGIYYLSLFPDVYGRGGSSLADVKKMLDSAGVLPLVDDARLRRLISRKNGLPLPILGEQEEIEVNGTPVPTRVRPVKVNGIWLTPVAGLEEALGISVEPLGDGLVRLRKDAKTCELRIGQPVAAVDGVETKLSAPPALLDGNLLVPLRLLLDLTGSTVSVEVGKAIRITAPS